MKSAIYALTNQSVQMSFKYKSHTNLAVGSTAATSAAIANTEVLLSLSVSAHVRIGSGPATVADMMLPSGVWPLVIPPGSTISVIKLTGSSDGQASIIIPE